MTSYQHCIAHKALNIGDDKDDGAIDDGAFHIPISTNESPSFLQALKQRIKRRAAPALLLTALSLTTARWACGALAPRRLRRSVPTLGSIPRPRHEDRALPDLIWSDEFDGDALDTTKWTIVAGDGCAAGLCGWGNDELETYAASNVRVADGALTLEARRGAAGYTSAKIVSRGKADFGLAAGTAGVDEDGARGSSDASRRFEARLQLPWGRGIWPAFWMLPTDDTYGGWPESGEIDIMENIGKEGPDTVHGTVHYGFGGSRHQYSEAGITLPAPYGEGLNSTFHTFAVDRLPGAIRWYVDDIEYSSITKEDMRPYRWPFDEDFYFILNLAVGGTWPGPPSDATAFPQRLRADYVRVYEGVFPRIAGKSVVECVEKDVAYEVVNVRTADGTEVAFTWSVPQYATIEEGQGTARIVVDFDVAAMEQAVIDDAIVRVQAHGLGNRGLSTGLTKLQEHGLGLRVNIVDFDGKCSTSNAAQTRPEKYAFDCGRPAECTPFVLHRTTDEFTCGERIAWLMEEGGLTETAACREVGEVQFHGHCGPCAPPEG